MGRPTQVSNLIGQNLKKKFSGFFLPRSAFASLVIEDDDRECAKEGKWLR
jgi:hypothetical protein